MFFFLRPIFVGMTGKGIVAIASVVRHIGSDPVGYLELSLFTRDFDFGKDKPFVVAMEYINFPIQAFNR